MISLANNSILKQVYINKKIILALVTNQQSKNTNPILTFEGKRYDIHNLPNEVKEIVKGLQVADNQLHLYEDTLKVLAVGRQSLAKQLKDSLKNIKSMQDD